ARPAGRVARRALLGRAAGSDPVLRSLLAGRGLDGVSLAGDVDALGLCLFGFWQPDRQHALGIVGFDAFAVHVLGQGEGANKPALPAPASISALGSVVGGALAGDDQLPVDGFG